MYDVWAQEAIALGFHGVASGPLVRSSYKAGLLYRKTRDPLNKENLPGAYVMVKQNNDLDRHALKPILHEVEQ
jgi:lipoic acid synthetase